MHCVAGAVKTDDIGQSVSLWRSVGTIAPWLIACAQMPAASPTVRRRYQPRQQDAIAANADRGITFTRDYVTPGCVGRPTLSAAENADIVAQVSGPSIDGEQVVDHAMVRPPSATKLGAPVLTRRRSMRIRLAGDQLRLS